MKKFLKKAVCGILAITAVSASVATFSGCETSHPEVQMEIEFNGKTYTLEYKLYRKIAPATVNHFLKLAENGYYDGVCVHDYDASGSKLYTGGYTAADNEYGLEYKPYYDIVKTYENFPTTVWLDGKGGTPTYTVRGEFSANNFVVENGYVEQTFGSLTMYYTEKDSDVKVAVERADGESTSNKKYDYNSATSLFYISLSESTSTNTKYCTFATLEDGSVEDLKDLKEAIASYIADNYGSNEEENTSFVTSQVVEVDRDDVFVGESENTEIYDVPNEPIVIKKVSVTKY